MKKESIRKATKKDIPDIVAVNSQLLHGFCEERWVKTQIEDGNFYKLGRSFVCLHRTSKSIRILTLAVSKECQRKGVGRRLVNFVINKAKKERMRRVLVGSYYKFRAKGFYLKCGFRLVYEDDDLNYNFEKSLVK